MGNSESRKRSVLPNVAKDFIDHATEENYDHWYFGFGALEESLRDKVFNIRDRVSLPVPFDLRAGSAPAGSWTQLGSRSAESFRGPPTPALLSLARATIHASVFETAFHNQTSNDLSKFSTGAYINPGQQLTKLWPAFPRSPRRKPARRPSTPGSTPGRKQRTAAPTTAAPSPSKLMSILMAKDEYFIYNDRLVRPLRTAIGGRMIGAWLRDIDTGYVSQVVGNLASYAGSETEEEGAGNFSSGAGQRISHLRIQGLVRQDRSPPATGRSGM